MAEGGEEEERKRKEKKEKYWRFSFTGDDVMGLANDDCFIKDSTTLLDLNTFHTSVPPLVEDGKIGIELNGAAIIACSDYIDAFVIVFEFGLLSYSLNFPVPTASRFLIANTSPLLIFVGYPKVVSVSLISRI